MTLTIHDHPSPNFGARREGARPDMVVLHYTAMATSHAALERLCCPDHQVSAHYLIAEDGTVHCLVDEEMRAWHAGAGQWGACDDVNSRSIGIELANPGTAPFAAAQMDALEALLGQITARHAIPPERVIGHSDMAPARKIDPGPRFDWRRLARQGLAVWAEPVANCTSDTLYADLRAFGYPDLGLDLVLPAFRSRFAPHRSGPADERDAGLARDLALRFPVDRTPASA